MNIEDLTEREAKDLLLKVKDILVYRPIEVKGAMDYRFKPSVIKEYFGFKMDNSITQMRESDAGTKAKIKSFYTDPTKKPRVSTVDLYDKGFALAQSLLALGVPEKHVNKLAGRFIRGTTNG